ncbi:hypothetical protein BYT27DRAFT_7201762, partial [Phlegmacium glaucopus]
VATTALLCAFSITPYIYLNRGANNLQKSTRWLFPVLRATGGFITATLIQLLIQRRITTLSDQYLVKRDQLPDTDIKAAVKPHDTKKHPTDALTWLLLCLLLIGILASVVGWLCLEAGLSVMRLGIWAWNPKKDDAPPLEIILELDEHEPLPTCNKDNEEILKRKIITSFAGLIEPFGSPDLSLYYTLTRKRPSIPAGWGPWGDRREDRDNEPENAEKHKLGERILYITVFDHKERTTRVYTRDNEIDTFYSTNSDAPLVDVGHLLLEVEIQAEIDPKADPVSSDSNNVDSLRKHHRSILEHIQYRLGAADVSKAYTIENSWTMKVADTMSALQRLREEENGDNWKTAVEKGKTEEQNEESLLLCDYFMQSSIERERRLLDEKRVKWIARRMEMMTKEVKERFEGEIGVEYRVNKRAVEKKPAIEFPEWEMEKLLILEQYLMELLLVYEVKEWEQLFWNKFKDVLDQISNDGVEEKERLTRELNPQMRAAEKRLADLDKDDDWDHRRIMVQRVWASYIGKFFEGVEKPNSEVLSELRREMKYSSLVTDEIRLRMDKELEDTAFRLKRGSELGRFDQFWDDDTLFECRYSRSKWLYLSTLFTSTPLEIYSHALEGNKNIIHITFGYSDSDVNWIQATICDLPWLTSISQDWSGRPPLDLGMMQKISISFVAPISGQSLVLRLKHSGKEDAPLEVTLGSTIIQLNPSSESLTIDDITLHPIPGPSESDYLSFEPGRNDIVIQFRETVEDHGHFLHDVELLDEAGKHYGMQLYS